MMKQISQVVRNLQTSFSRKPQMVVTLIVVALLLLGLAASSFLVKRRQELPSKAAGNVNLALIPSKTVVAPGEEFDVFINITPNDTEVTAVELQITFDTQKLQAVGSHPISLPVGPTIFLNNILPNCTYATPPNCPRESTVNGNLATMYLGVTCTETGCGTTPTTGTHTLAVFHLRANSNVSGPASINFKAPPEPDPGSTTPATRVAAKNQDSNDQVGTLTDTSITISPGGSPLPSSSPDVSPSTGTGEVTLKVRFEGVFEARPDKTMEVTLKTGDTPIITETLIFTADSAGVYQNVSAMTNVPPNTYDIFIDGPTQLTKKYSGVTITQGSNTIDLTSPPLLSGDIFDDEWVNANDYTDVVTFYGCELPPASPPPGKSCDIFDADLDFDGKIRAADYNFVVGNYGLRGD